MLQKPKVFVVLRYCALGDFRWLNPMIFPNQAIVDVFYGVNHVYALHCAIFGLYGLRFVSDLLLICTVRTYINLLRYAFVIAPYPNRPTGGYFVSFLQISAVTTTVLLAQQSFHYAGSLL